MLSEKQLIHALGNEPPISNDGNKLPERRDVSFRWLCGTFLTGLTSTILMGAALLAALNGRQKIAIPAEAYSHIADENSKNLKQKRGARLSRQIPKAADKNIIEVATLIKNNEKEFLKKIPFAHVKMTLANQYQSTENYPPFNPLSIFLNENLQKSQTCNTLYSTKTESEVILKTSDFPQDINNLQLDKTSQIREIEKL